MLIKEILNTLIQKGGYKLAWLAYFELNKEKDKLIVPKYFAGEIEYAISLQFDLNDPKVLKGPSATNILTHKTTIMNSSQEDPNYLVWKDKAKKHGLGSSISIYLDVEGNEKATISIYSANPRAFDSREVVVLERLAQNISFAIKAIRNHKKSLQFEEELFQSKKTIEERLKEFTLLVKFQQLAFEKEKDLFKSLSQLVKEIPFGWYWPEDAEARIQYGDLEFYSGEFENYEAKLEVIFETIDQVKGCIQVFYLKKLPESFQGPFLKEEVRLLSVLAQILTTKLNENILQKRIFQSEKRLSKIIDHSDSSYMLLDENFNVIYCNNHVVQNGKKMFNIDLNIGKNLIEQQTPEHKEKFTKFISSLEKGNEIEYVTERIDAENKLHVYGVKLIKTNNLETNKVEIIFIANDISHLKQREEDLNNLVNLLKDLNFITSFEISHEFHKLQSIVELAQDLDFVEADLKEIFSHSKETFKKADASIKKLIERINIPLKEEIVMANNLRRIEKIIILDEDTISSKISMRMLAKFFDPVQIICFSTVDETIAYFKSKGDTGNDIILLETDLKLKSGWDFLKYYESHKLKSPVIVMSANVDHDLQQRAMSHYCVKNCINKPVNRETAELIHSKEIFSWNMSN